MNWSPAITSRCSGARRARPADRQRRRREQGRRSGSVLSFRLWQRRFGGDPGAIGSTIKLDGHDFVIIGVAGEQFEGIKTGAPRDVWVPILTLRRTDPTMITRFDQRRASWLEMFGRLKPGVTFDQARTQFAAIAARLAQRVPRFQRPCRQRNGARVGPGLRRAKGDTAFRVFAVCRSRDGAAPSHAPTWPGCCWRVPPAVNLKSRPGSRSAPDVSARTASS